MRYAFLRWLNFKVFKTPEGQESPKIVIFFRYMLFPLDWMYASQARIHYNYITDVYTIRGVNITGAIFDSWQENAPTGTLFMFVENVQGYVLIKTVEAPEDKLTSI